MTLNIRADYSLKEHNTLGFEQSAEFYCAPQCDAELEAALAYTQENRLNITVLGGGSNLVLTRDIAGMVIHPAYTGLRMEPGDVIDATYVHAGAGIGWNDLVNHTLSLGLQGLENLTLIPGTVGAAPVQNIGAYGVEVEQRIVSLRAIHLATRQWKTFNTEQCQFSYRNSFFKHNPHQYLITEVCFRLGACNPLNTSYESLASYLQQHSDATANPDALQIGKAVASIRSSRLPDPARLANVGSFFHNPIVSNEKASQLHKQFKNIPVYRNGERHSKLSAAWLIDHAGLKGHRCGAVGVYDKQALVLVNHGDGNGEQLLALAAFIQQRIRQRYDVELQIEPMVI